MVEKKEIPAGIRMKGGVAYDTFKEGYIAIVHSWDNVECLGEPLEWSSPQIFKTEDAAMRYYKKSIRPGLKRKMKEAAKASRVKFAHRELE